jgi:hypothetical protein
MITTNMAFLNILLLTVSSPKNNIPDESCAIIITFYQETSFSFINLMPSLIAI